MSNKNIESMPDINSHERNANKNHLEINYTSTNPAILATDNTMCLQRYKENANVHCWCIWQSFWQFLKYTLTMT